MATRAENIRINMRRRHEEAHENHERWVISYADFITLLFAFFVVMYSISSVNEGKYKVLSDSLVSVFNKKATGSRHLEVLDQKSGSSANRMIPLPIPGDYPAMEDYKYSVEGLIDDADSPALIDGPEEGEVEELSKISDEIAVAFQGLISEELYTIRTTKDWIEVDIQSSVLFPSGRAQLSTEARELLTKISKVLGSYENPINVEGYTDNRPIETLQFPSNWELSSARAAAVVRLMETQEIDPKRLAAVGYGEHHPLADNESEEGRAKNRRVALIISKNKPDEKENVDKQVDYKVGAGVTDDDEPIGSDPQSRLEAAKKSSTRVPLKIIQLQNGGMLFSADPQPRETPLEPSGSTTNGNEASP
ncbi:MAG: flagellar motor protein MotD [Pseudomonadales bacterium]|nr:flagellar motor protein MotD [Pseudomonadales bacterium]